MRLSKVVLEKFKKVDKVEIDLSPINVLVGGNNAGKSSVLQGIHFSVIASIASREAGKDTYTQDSLLFCPAMNFEELRHGSGYLNQSQFGNLKLEGIFPDGAAAHYNVRIYRGRNQGNVGCLRTGSPRLGALIASSEQLFSIYVPGLAGIPQMEQFRTESVVRRGVASGDANLYLRNVLWLIKQKNKLAALIKRMHTLFPKFHIQLKFNPSQDVVIDAKISTSGPTGRLCPVELVGTGVLQALQIFSYVTLFEPSLLLLDEPDAHLHPDNQALLASALQYISSETDTQVIIATHSRHLVDALHEDANFVWLKEGRVFEQGVELPKIPLLLDIGALDGFDKLMAGAIEWVILSEDTDLSLIKTLAESSGFNPMTTLFFSYKTSSNLEPAKILASFINEISPTTKVVIHRDRDFMTNEEVIMVSNKIELSEAAIFITEGADVESYFVRADHLAACVGEEKDVVEAWLGEIALANHNELVHSFTRKRDEVKGLLYRKDPAQFPGTLNLLGQTIPLSPDKRHGKFMLKKVRANLKPRFGDNAEIIFAACTTLKSEKLAQIHDTYDLV
jgi:energy-coupling factor transporter ATP-binding protein EcfA2